MGPGTTFGGINHTAQAQRSTMTMEGAVSDNTKGLALAVASSAFIGASFILKKIGLLRAAKCGDRAGNAPNPRSLRRVAALSAYLVVSTRVLGSHPAPRGPGCLLSRLI